MSDIKIVTKPWGKEEWLELNESYCYKRIYINAGYKTSFQYHEKKRETNYIISGTAEVWLENDDYVIEKKIMTVGEYFNVTPPKKHRVVALTDLILQEVSTPEVNDVVRIEDDTGRNDGLVEGEHLNPGVLILAAGLGSRLKHHTEKKNKALIPINNEAIISHIINKFPVKYDIVIAVGYKSESLKDYCQFAHADRKITFVDVDKFENSNVGPGYSTLQCKSYLQRPFYITTVDCMIDSELPKLDGNWLGVCPTGIPEKYSTVKIDENGNIIEFKNKSSDGFDNAFIGLAAIWDYETFWKELKSNMANGNNTELISAWINPLKYKSLKAKEIKWFDTGTLDDLKVVKDHFNDNPLSLYKNTHEVTYKIGNKFLKFNPDKQLTKNRFDRGLSMVDLIPEDINISSNFTFISYNWIDGNSLYAYNSIVLYSRFLEYFGSVIKDAFIIKNDRLLNFHNHGQLKYYYEDKPKERKELFENKYGKSYSDVTFTINGKKYPSLDVILSKVNILDIRNISMFYNKFHGDLQFDNIIYNDKTEKFTYIDWRNSYNYENINNAADSGDLYYDLAKLYGGSLIDYSRIKNDDIIYLIEGTDTIQYDYIHSQQLIDFTELYEKWLISNGYNLNTIKLITGLIYLSMSPLHTDKANKLLFFKSIEMLYAALYK